MRAEPGPKAARREEDRDEPRLEQHPVRLVRREVLQRGDERQKEQRADRDVERAARCCATSSSDATIPAATTTVSARFARARARRASARTRSASDRAERARDAAADSRRREGCRAHRSARGSGTRASRTPEKKISPSARRKIQRGQSIRSSRAVAERASGAPNEGRADANGAGLDAVASILAMSAMRVLASVQCPCVRSGSASCVRWFSPAAARARVRRDRHHQNYRETECARAASRSSSHSSASPHLLAACSAAARRMRPTPLPWPTRTAMAQTHPQCPAGNDAQPHAARRLLRHRLRRQHRHGAPPRRRA